MPSRYEINETKRKKQKKEKNKSLAKKLAIFLIIVIVVLAIWGKFIEPNLLATNEYKIENKNIPDSFNNTKIVQFSDLHYGIGNSKKKLENLTNKINSINPDIVIFTGDLIDKNYTPTESDIKLLTKKLSEINSKLGKYACIGNHDATNEHYDNIMYDSNFKILKNNYDTIYNKTNTPILLYGLDNITYGAPKIETIKNKEIDNIAYKIVILHEPDYIDEFINNYDVDLILAGHSHNGQAKLPKIKPLYLPKGAKTYYKESYKINDTQIYISNGVGNSVIDFRLFNTPSINLYKLSN